MSIANTIFRISMSLIIIFGITSIGSIVTTKKDIVVTSHVEHVDYLKDYMKIHFRNGQNYNVMYSMDTTIDFDESKNVTIKLDYNNLFWCTNTNDCWTIMNIIKY